MPAGAPGTTTLASEFQLIRVAPHYAIRGYAEALEAGRIAARVDLKPYYVDGTPHLSVVDVPVVSTD
jgi:hypothetical protein